MLLIPKQQDRLEQLAVKLQTANAPTSDLVAELVSNVCPRMALLNKSGAAALQFERLTKTSAWTDVAIALIGLELPAWKLRRLVYEDGAWFCSLSQRTEMPVELDDTADARHENLPLAILSAFVEARRRNTASATEPQTVPQIRPAPGYAICCDNFA